MLKSRKELIHDVGFRAFKCGLCGNGSNAAKNIRHAGDCPLKDPGNTHVRLVGQRARVVISGPRDRDGKLWWRSGLSGKVYDIERSGRCVHPWKLYERVTGKVLLKNVRLRDIRKYIVDNQGVL